MDKKLREYLKTLDAETEETKKLEHSIEQKKEKFENEIISKLKNYYNKIEEKRAEFLRSIKSEIDLLKQKKDERKKIERNIIATVSIGDLVAEIKKITAKTRSSGVEIYIDNLFYPWGRVNDQQLEKNILSGEFCPQFDVHIFNKNYKTNPIFFYKKIVQVSPYLQFKDGKSFSKSCIIDYGANTSSIKIKNYENMMLKFTVKDLTRDSNAWEPVDIIRNAVINCIERENNKKQTMGD